MTPCRRLIAFHAAASSPIVVYADAFAFSFLPRLLPAFDSAPLLLLLRRLPLLRYALMPADIRLPPPYIFCYFAATRRCRFFRCYVAAPIALLWRQRHADVFIMRHTAGELLLYFAATLRGCHAARSFFALR